MASAFARDSVSLEEEMGLEWTLQERYNALVCEFIADPFQRQHDIQAHARITALYASIKAECLSLPQYMEVAKYYGFTHTIASVFLSPLYTTPNTRILETGLGVRGHDHTRERPEEAREEAEAPPKAPAH